MSALINETFSVAPERFREAMSRVGSAVHIVTTVGLASALISFAALERRALRNA